MGPDLATIAAGWIKPRVAIPIHYKTWDLLAQTAVDFKPNGIEVKEMEPGDKWDCS